VTVPKPAREALGLTEGDQVIFRVEDNRVTVGNAPGFLDLAGTVPVPAAKRNAPCDAVLRRTRAARAARHV
jgi:AbrB family looped-hinge helix DNA binding protein